MLEFTPDEIRLLCDYANDPTSTRPEDDTLKRLFYLSSQLQKNLVIEVRSERNKNKLLQSKIERLSGRLATTAPQGELKELGLDSVDVAKALLYRLKAMKAYNMTKTKLMLLLYEAYASWLASKRERLVIEHPVATEQGPWFWRVARKVDIIQNGNDNDYRVLAEQNAGVAAFINNVANKYYDYSESDLKTYILKSIPYRSAGRETNDGKWNKQLSDDEIIAWKLEK